MEGNKEGNKIPEKETPKAVKMKRGYSEAFINTKEFLKDILDIRAQTDKTSTIETIKADIPFKGHTAWILVCSIMIASIGLNANSIPVVIGAMLISPLMGPILGIGLSIATHDIETLNSSLKNFGVMVILSILTAFLFFFIFPLKEESSELLTRTYPDIRDVLVAFFGGLALIIARTKTGTIASVIFGVAIATALMPPLCTAGFGLAIGRFDYFFGAMYLFTINTIFIALSTYIVLKLLHFPMAKYAPTIRRRRISQMVSVTAFLVMLPALWTFYNVFQRSLFQKQANDFIIEFVDPTVLVNGRFLETLTQIDYNRKGDSEIELVFMGNQCVSPSLESTWVNQMHNYSKLKNTKLKITQGIKNQEIETAKYIKELYESKKRESKSKDATILDLTDEINRLQKGNKIKVPFEEIASEARILYKDLSSLGYYYEIKTNFKRIDTLLVFTTQWQDNLSGDIDKVNMENYEISSWLETKLKLDTIKVKSVE